MKLGKSILKVGYLNKRMYQYFSANPGFDVLGIREGDEILEDMIQIYLTYLGYQRRVGKRLNEWFDDRPEIQQIFHISRDRLERILWGSREKIFNFTRTTHLNIYEYLREKNLDSYSGVNYKLDEDSNIIIPIKYNKLDLYYQTNLKKLKHHIQIYSSNYLLNQLSYCIQLLQYSLIYHSWQYQSPSS